MSTTCPQGSDIAVQQRIVRVLTVVQVVGGIGNGAGISVGALLVKDVSGSSGWAGMAVVMLTLGAAVFAVPLSSLAARAGRCPALTLGWASGAMGAALTVVGAQTRFLPLLLVGLLLFGASSAANLQSRFAAVDRAEPARVGRTLSLVVWSTTARRGGRRTQWIRHPERGRCRADDASGCDGAHGPPPRHSRPWLTNTP